MPKEKLREEVVALATRLMRLNPAVLRATKQALKTTRHLTEDQALDYLAAKSAELGHVDAERGRAKALQQFLDDKSYRPGLGPYDREAT